MSVAGTFSQKYKGIHWLCMNENGKRWFSITSNVTDGSAASSFFSAITDTYTQHIDLSVYQSLWVGECSNPLKGAPSTRQQFHCLCSRQRIWSVFVFEVRLSPCLSQICSFGRRPRRKRRRKNKNTFPESPQSLRKKSAISFRPQKKIPEKGKAHLLVSINASRCGVAACILPKIVILLHVLHVCCSELSQVLGAAVVHSVWWCKAEVLVLVVALGLHFRKNLRCNENKETVLILLKASLFDINVGIKG